MKQLLSEIKACNLCEDRLPFKPNPILQIHAASEILIIGQAPGLKAHQTGIPWNDASGVRFRDWLQISFSDFYNPKKISIVPMGFCYPGRGKSGDLPPLKECSIRWMDSILADLKNLKLIVLVGNYSTQYFLGLGSLAPRIKQYALNLSPYIVLPHPSPRNNIWLKKNPWFELECLEQIRKKLRSRGLESGDYKENFL